MEHTKMQRLLKMLLLLSGNRHYSVTELAERFETAERTVYRYLETFEAAGFLLSKRDSGYALQTDGPNYRSLQKLLHFSEEEAYILFQTLSLLEGSSPIKERLVKKLNVLYDFHVLTQYKNSNQLKIVHTLGKAMDDKKQVEIKDYRSSHSETITNRNVEPFAFLPDYAAIWCFDTVSFTCKQFRVSRMREVIELSSNWQHESEHKVPFCDAFRMAAPKAIAKVEAVLSLKAYNLLIEEYPLAEVSIQKHQDNRYRLTIPVADFCGIGRFVLGLPGEIEIVAPESFKMFLEEKRKVYLQMTVVDS
jgi:proteasome accessory factor C